MKIKETLELTTFFIASEISNFQLFQRLEILSTMDILTGVKNRNSMNTLISDIKEGRMRIQAPTAVIFADLNGLKRVNDEQGHASGDQLLKTAASILGGVFYDTDVYRAGGDEFMILAQGMDEAELDLRLKRLYDQAKDAPDLHFAVGTAIINKEDELHTAMRLADEGMYTNKRHYYQNHPEQKYR